MKGMILAFLVFGVGFGTLSWLFWDHIARLKREIEYLRGRVEELRAHNAELVLMLESKAEAARIDEAIRKGRLPE